MDYIAHYGIKGQKWGVRRYQNPDGTLTVEGKRRTTTYAAPKSSENPYSARRTAKIHKRAEQLETASFKMNNVGKVYGTNSFQFRMARANQHAAADRYLSATKDRSRSAYHNRMLIGQALAGPVGQLAAASTKKGRAALNSYMNRLDEVKAYADIMSQVETQLGSDFIEGVWQDKGMSRRPDRY